MALRATPAAGVRPSPGRRPQRLGPQMLGTPAVVALVTLATTALLYVVSTRRLDAAAQQAGREWAHDIAQAAASAGTQALARDDLPGVEAALRDLARLPGVLRIDVVDRRAEPRLSLVRAPHGGIGVLAHPADLQLLRAGEQAVRALRIGAVDALQVWRPVAGGVHGSVGVTCSVAPARARLAGLRLDVLAGIALALLPMLVAAHAMLARGVAPLRRLAGVSHSPGRPRGAARPHAPDPASTTLQRPLGDVCTTREAARSLLDAVPDGVIGVDAAGRIDFASPAVRSVFGLEPAQIGGQPLETLLPGLDAAEAERRAAGGVCMRGARVARFEANARRRDGTGFPVDVSLSRIDGGDGALTCVIRDITEQRMTFSMLRRYGRALQCTSNGVVICDVTMPGAPIFYANEAFTQITGYQGEAAIGRQLGFLLGEDAEQPTGEALRAAIAAGRHGSVVLRCYRRDGTPFFGEMAFSPVAEPDGAVRHVVGVLGDVTEREHARLAIAERSARLDAVFDLSPDGFVVFDRDDRLVCCNRAFRAMSGWGGDGEPGAMSVAEFDLAFARPCDPAQPPMPIAQVIGDDIEAAEKITLLQPQRRVVARAMRRQRGGAGPLGDGRGELILFFRDITHETEVDRMKSEFLTTAAHELRTPMVSVFGFTELLLNRQVSEWCRQEVLETIHRQASRLIDMVNELLDLARIEARGGKDLKRGHCRLGDLVRQAAEPFAHTAGPHRLHVQVAHDAAGLYVDPERTRRALTQVLSNAYQYSPQGGDITVDTRLGDAGGQGAVGVRVRDHGIGMTPDQVARVFERFYRADPSSNRPGTGLGMSLVKEIVELQGGRVELESRHGAGTEVILWLPLAAEVVPSG